MHSLILCVSLSLWYNAVDVDELVTKFLESEDKNFSLFNYVNELNNEIEQVRFPFGCLSLLCSLSHAQVKCSTVLQINRIIPLCCGSDCAECMMCCWIYISWS